MTTEETKQQLIEAQALAHQQWLQHPVTVTVLRALEIHKKKFVNLVSCNASTSTISDSSIRHLCISIRDFDAAIQLIKNFSALVDKLNEQNDN